MGRGSQETTTVASSPSRQGSSPFSQVVMNKANLIIGKKKSKAQVKRSSAQAAESGGRVRVMEVGDPIQAAIDHPNLLAWDSAERYLRFFVQEAPDDYDAFVFSTDQQFAIGFSEEKNTKLDYLMPNFAIRGKGVVDVMGVVNEIWASGDSIVRLHNSFSQAHVSERATLNTGSAKDGEVFADEESAVYISGSIRAQATGKAQVFAKQNCLVDLHDDASATVANSATCDVYDQAKADASGEAIIRLYSKEGQGKARGQAIVRDFS